jgi:hypothetical protein
MGRLLIGRAEGRRVTGRSCPDEDRFRGRANQHVLPDFAALGTNETFLVEGDLAPVMFVLGTAISFFVFHGRHLLGKTATNVRLN